MTRELCDHAIICTNHKLCVNICWFCYVLPCRAQLLTMPEKTPEQLAAEAAAAAAAASGKKGAAAKPKAGGKDAPPPEVDLAKESGSPTQLLTPDLAARLNPVVICPLRANALPDAPATRTQLEQKCAPVRLRVRWPAGAEAREQVGRPGGWARLEPVTSGGPGLSCRAVGFGQPDVMLAGDFSVGGGAG